MHFCEVVALRYGRVSLPRNVSLNWFIPAFVNSSVGSSPGTSEELGTMVCPCFWKYSRKLRRISRERITLHCKGAPPVFTGRSEILASPAAQLAERIHHRGGRE